MRFGWVVVAMEKKLGPLVMFCKNAAGRLLVTIFFDLLCFVFTLLWFYWLSDEKIDATYQAVTWVWFVIAFIRFILLIAMGVLARPLIEKVLKIEMPNEWMIEGKFPRWYRGRRGRRGYRRRYDQGVVIAGEMEQPQNPGTTSFTGNQQPPASSYPSQEVA